MNEQIWLPETCLADPLLAQPIATAVDMWCTHWLADTKWAVAERWSRKSGEGLNMLAAFELDNGLACFLPERGKVTIAAAMLGLPLDKGNPPKTDGQLIAIVADKALSDLADRLSRLPVPERTNGVASPFYVPIDWPRYELTIGNRGQRPVMSLQVDRQFLVHLAQSLARAPRALPAPVSRNEALGAGRVTVGAKIGAARLSLSELQGLGVGDVIALDQPVSGTFGLTVNGVEAMPSALQVKLDQDALHLQMTRPLN